uniref:Uncharacterized protein n=1 Tax=Amphimedon queenslandica TaxID=400682 RepID=A0A1X7VJC5_AMPQE
MEELKQRLNAKVMKVKRYEQWIKQYQQNRLFRVDQKRFYQQINGELGNEKIVPNAADSVRFWKGVWGSGVVHNKGAEWLKEVKKRFGYTRQEDVKIEVSMIRKRSMRMANWKIPGMDGVQGYWLKYLTACHERIARQLNEIVGGDCEVPQWLTYCRTVLGVKDVRR